MCSGYQMDQQMLGRASNMQEFFFNRFSGTSFSSTTICFPLCPCGCESAVGLSPRGNLVARLKDIDTL